MNESVTNPPRHYQATTAISMKLSLFSQEHFIVKGNFYEKS
jgi:hypothetical protein